jgi:GT2 family glycosyltransferase
MKFQIGIPTLNRFDLLMPSLLMYSNQFPDTKIYVLDNGNQKIKEREILKPLKNLIVIEKEQNIGVGASWNILCDEIFKESDCSFIVNDDILLKNTKSDIEELITKKKNKGNLLRATMDWCAFIMPKKVWNEVGKFDECFFPAYYEDNSYAYRMKLMGLFPIKTPSLNPYIYRSSQTIEKMPNIFEASKKNKQLYIEMWGGEPEREKFTKPFNKP